MKVLGKDIIYKFLRKHADSKNWLEAWLAEAQRDTWRTPQDIKNRYRSADFLAGDRVIFNIKGNKHRMVVRVRYRNGIVRIEWIGTHAEYSKKRF
jgi:mRNA interferase HigB